jgi:hypothetical protein
MSSGGLEWVNLDEISLLQVTLDSIWYTKLKLIEKKRSKWNNTKKLLLYLVIRGKLSYSGQHLWNRQVPLCPLHPLLKMHRS